MRSPLPLGGTRHVLRITFINRHRHAQTVWQVAAGQLAQRPLLNVERADDGRAVAGLFLVAAGVLGVFFNLEYQF